MSRFGITLPLHGLSLDAHRSRLAELIDLGYTDVWSQEVSGNDAFIPLAFTAAAERRFRLGTAIAAVTTRGAALLAMSAAALAEAAPGRFVLGIGASSQAIVESWNAHAFDRPYARVRDSLRFLRRVFAGERIDESFETFACRGFRLERPPTVAPPIYLAALRRRMLELARTEADGVLLSFVAPDEVKPLVGGEGWRGKDVVLRIPVIVCEERERSRAIARRTLANYFNVPVYAAFRRELDGAETLDAMWSAWQAGDREAARAAIPAELVDQIFVHGPVEECRAGIARFIEAGVTTPVLAVVATDGDSLEAVRRLAPGA